MEIRREENAGRITLRLHGTFDGRAAQLLRQSLTDAGEVPVVVDFSQVTTFRDAAVPTLTRALKERQAEVRGLGTHQARVLRYFGIEVPSLSRPYWSAEEALAY